MAKQETVESPGYARELKLSDGRRVSLRLMEAADKQRVLSFARSLPPDDLLFLRTDITEPALIDEWIGNLEKGTTMTVLADVDGELAGYASLHLEQARWTRRVGEIRVQVAVVGFFGEFECGLLEIDLGQSLVVGGLGCLDGWAVGPGDGQPGTEHLEGSEAP